MGNRVSMESLIFDGVQEFKRRMKKLFMASSNFRKDLTWPLLRPSLLEYSNSKRSNNTHVHYVLLCNWAPPDPKK
eukprot:925586-Amphidinium_carterae.1